MSNLSSDEYVAKLDLYDSETKWQSNSPDKKTFILENVTGIQQTNSSTHQYAFEVVEKQPVLVLSGSSLEETCGWMVTLQQIFTPWEILTSKGWLIGRLDDWFIGCLVGRLLVSVTDLRFCFVSLVGCFVGRFVD